MTTMNETPDELNAFIIRQTNEHWEKKKSPYLLSNISTDLIPYGVNYRNIIGEGTTLKQYVSGLPPVRVVVHPIQKAKVGLVPASSGFAFEMEPTVTGGSGSERPKRPRMPSQKHIVMQFLNLLSKLSAEELKSVTIPVHVLAKLVEDE
jgi:hypothetical protein